MVLRESAPQKGQIKIEEYVYENVESFCYLGSIIDKEGGSAADVKRRIIKAQAAFNTLNSLWNTKDISFRIKLRIFNSNVKSILLYGCETW